MLVENDASGNPTARSAENPAFYRLINTKGTIRNTDDGTEYLPRTVVYNAIEKSATLKYTDGSGNPIDLNDLNPEGASFRLRIGTRETIPFQPTRQSVGDFGDTFANAMNIGNIVPNSLAGQTTQILSSTIQSTSIGLDQLGASDDPGHRNLGAINFENHINDTFGADTTPGSTRIYYNFRADYLASGSSVLNTITETQKTRVREALAMWARYLGIQFVETDKIGLTFAMGDINQVLSQGLELQNRPELSMTTRIDPTYNNGLLVLGSSAPNNVSWNENYGENFYRIVMSGIGMLLGLENAANVAASNLMNFYAPFLTNNPNEPSLVIKFDFSNNTPTALTEPERIRVIQNLEPVFPGPQDIQHGQHVHRADSSDIDLYRFQVDFGPNGNSRLGFFEAETFAERAENASSLDTHLTLYKQTQATASNNFNAGMNLRVDFEALEAGSLGNHLKVVVSRSPLPGNSLPIVRTFPGLPNTILVELDSTTGTESTVQEFIDAINNHPVAGTKVRVKLGSGSGSTVIGDKEVVYSPIELLGGKIERIAQNDNYFSDDSLIRLQLSSGIYFVGVSASGNDNYNPDISNSGIGGRTDGDYQLRLNFRPQVTAIDTIQDNFGVNPSDVGQPLDGDGDGIPGGTYNFWFETRALNRTVSIDTAGDGLSSQPTIVAITGATGVVRRYELTTLPTSDIGNIRVGYTTASTQNDIAAALVAAINGQTSGTGVSASLGSGGTTIVLDGERSLVFSPNAAGISTRGKTIFVDKVAGPNANGSLARPFNNVQNSAVANAFGAARDGDIVRIVGNAGNDGIVGPNAVGINDDLAYEFGFGLLPGQILSDGDSMLIPKGVVTMVDAGAVFKLRRTRIAVGSSNVDVDRSNAGLQILGTPDRQVYFTSWLDETIGRDTFTPMTTPLAGDWGGIIFQGDIDRSLGRIGREEEGIFVNYVNNATILYGGGGGIQIDSVEQIVNPIQIVDMRPTIVFNTIQRSSDAAMSATPDSFEETLFTESVYQFNGEFAPTILASDPTFSAID